MNGSRAFFDTNVLIYAFAQDDSRATIAEDLLAQGGVISLQVLNEFVSVATRKLKMPWDELNLSLTVIRTLCPTPAPITLELHERALTLAHRYRYQIYDALIIAAALDSSCGVLYTEDLRDGQSIEGLVIRNPFVMH